MLECEAESTTGSGEMPKQKELLFIGAFISQVSDETLSRYIHLLIISLIIIIISLHLLSLSYTRNIPFIV